MTCLAVIWIPLDPLGLLSHLGYLGIIGNLNTLDPEPIDAPLHTFIEEEELT
jgi:hypothetical protein